MSEIGKFQLPPIKGTDVFPSTMQAPPIVRMSVEYPVDPDRPFRPEVLEDYARTVLANNLGQIEHFVLAQRQNYLAGIVEFTKTSRSFDDFDISYSNNQNRHEIISLKVRVPIRRKGGEELEQDQLMLLVLHDGNKLTAIPMGTLSTGNLKAAYSHECKNSFWGDYQYFVNQLPLGKNYSVIASEFNFQRRRINYIGSSLTVVTKDPKSVFRAQIDLPESSPFPMNGSNDTFYLYKVSVDYDSLNHTLTKSGMTTDGSAVSADGSWSKDELQTTLYVNSIAMSGGKTTVRSIPLGKTETNVSRTKTTTNYIFTSTDTGSRCGILNTVTVMPETRTESASGPIITSRSFDGISLGSLTVTQKTHTQNSAPMYIVTHTWTYGAFPVTGFHPLTGQIGGGTGDGAQVGPIFTGGGSVTSSAATSDPSSGSETFSPPNFALNPAAIGCGIVVSPFDYAAGGPWNISSESVDAAVARIAAEHAGDCTTCNPISHTWSSSGGYTDSVTESYPEIDGFIGYGERFLIPYAVDDALYYGITTAPGNGTVHTPYGQTGYDMDGYFNVHNGKHLIQGFTFDRHFSGGGQDFIMLDGDDITSALSDACETGSRSINAIFMDIPLSKIVLFD